MKWKTLHNEWDGLKNDPASSEYLWDFMKELRSNVGDAQKLASRLMVSFVFVAVLFVLLNRSAPSEFVFGPIKVADVSLISRTLPVIGGYLYFSLTGLFVTIQMLRGLHGEVLAHRAPELSESGIHSLLLPPSTFYILNIGDAFSEKVEGVIGIISFVFAVFVFAVVFLFPLAFEVYMHWQLFLSFGHSNALVWSGVVPTTVFAAQAIANLAVYLGADPRGQANL
jgi:hypothetical protein